MTDNGQGMVEVKPKRRNRIKNRDLPPDLLLDDIWQKKFIPLLMTWAGTQVDPWTPDDSKIGDAIKLMGRTLIRPDFKLTPSSISKTSIEVSRVSCI